MTSRKKRRSSLYARYNKQLVEHVTQSIESVDHWYPQGRLSSEQVKAHALGLAARARKALEQTDGHVARKQFLGIMAITRVRERAPLPARLLYMLDVCVALVYADGESLLESLGCLLPRRERDMLLGDAIEAVRLQHSLSVGKPWRKFAVLATTAFWAGVIVKSAVLFLVFSHLPKRSR